MINNEPLMLMKALTKNQSDPSTRTETFFTKTEVERMLAFFQKPGDRLVLISHETGLGQKHEGIEADDYFGHRYDKFVDITDYESF